MSDISKFKVGNDTFYIKDEEAQSSITNLNGRMTAAETALAGKVDKVTGKGLSENDYTTAEKTKLAGLSNYDDTALTGRVTAAETVIEAIVNEYGAKNLLPLHINDTALKDSNRNPGTWSGNSYTYKGVTATFDCTSSGYIKKITLNGTSEDAFTVWLYIGLADVINGLILTGNQNLSGDIQLGIVKPASPWTNYGTDSGEGVIINGIPSGEVAGCALVVNQAVTLNNVVLYPMIRDARITDPTYVPYAMTNRELTERVTQSEFVSIGTDGVKTQKQLMQDLYALVDTSKISMQSKLVLNNANSLSFFSLTEKALDNRFLCFMHTAASSAVGEVIETYQLGDGPAYAGKAYGGTEHETSSEVLSAGMSFTVYY